MKVICRLMLGILLVTVLLACAKQATPMGETSLNGKARFTVSKEGLVTDFQTGLMWAPAPDRDVNWNQADEYAKNLKIGGYSDWRLPKLRELKSLYKQEKALRALHFTKWAWTSDMHPALTSAWLLNLDNGSEFVDNVVDSRTNRVLPVRGQE
jgi:hypothetical protein